MCPGGGATLVAYYSETEWAKYADDVRGGVGTARLPDVSRRCLLCMRYDVNRWVVNLRAENMALRHQETPAVLAPFYNLVDVPGEYRMEDCIVCTNEVYEGLLMPVVQPSLRGFQRLMDTRTGTVRFQQLLPYPDTPAGPGRAAPRLAGALPHF